MIKVTFLINSLSSGGAENLIIDIANSIDNSKIECEIVCLTSLNNTLESKIQKKEIHLTYLSRGSVYNPFLIFKLRHILRGACVVHVNLFPSSYFCVLAYITIKKTLRPVMIFTEHSTNNKRRNKWYLNKAEKFIYTRFYRVAAISEGVRNSFLNWLPEFSEKVKVIHNGIDLKLFGVNAGITGNKRKTRKILCVGGLRPVKDHPTLLKAFSLLPDAFELHLVGDGSEKNNITDLAGNLKIRDRVILHGFRNDIQKVYHEFDLFVLPSRWEGFGLSAAEAMASGIPVLVSNVEGLNEVVGDGGFYFEPGNATDLAGKIIYIFDHPDEIDLKVRNGLERVRMFSLVNTVKNYSDLYQEAANKLAQDKSEKICI